MSRREGFAALQPCHVRSFSETAHGRKQNGGCSTLTFVPSNPEFGMVCLVRVIRQNGESRTAENAGCAHEGASHLRRASITAGEAAVVFADAIADGRRNSMKEGHGEAAPR